MPQNLQNPPKTVCVYANGRDKTPRIIRFALLQEPRHITEADFILQFQYEYFTSSPKIVFSVLFLFPLYSSASDCGSLNLHNVIQVNLLPIPFIFSVIRIDPLLFLQRSLFFCWKAGGDSQRHFDTVGMLHSWMAIWIPCKQFKIYGSGRERITFRDYAFAIRVFFFCRTINIFSIDTLLLQ